MVHLKVSKRVKSEKFSSHGKNTSLFFFSCLLSLWDYGCWITLLWLSFCNIYKSNHFLYTLNLYSVFVCALPCPTFCIQPHGLKPTRFLPMEFSRLEYGGSGHFLLQNLCNVFCQLYLSETERKEYPHFPQ